MYGRVVKTLLDVRPLDLAFDVGANVGDFTAGLVMRGCRVIAIEPQRAVHEKLYARYKRLPQVKCLCTGVSDHVGEAEISLCGEGTYVSDTGSDYGRTHIANPYAPVRGNFPKQKCPLTTLDLLIARYGLPRAIKIDVEGYEPQVLRGLSQPVHCLSFEVHSNYMEKLKICVELLERLGRYEYNLRRDGTADHFAFETWYPAARMDRLLETAGQHQTFWDVYATCMSAT